MNASPFFSDLFGTLFFPYRTARQNRQRRPNPRAGHLFVLYLSVLLGVGITCFVSYPETLYFGLPAEALGKEVPAVVAGFPVFAALVTAACLAFFFGYNYLLVGLAGFRWLSTLAGPGGEAPDRFTYLSAFAFSFAPLLFWVPIMAIRQLFFERLIFLQPVYPFIDWTDANILHFVLVGACVAWKFLLQVRVNQALFRVPLFRASVPVLAEAVVLALFLAAPFLLNDLIYDAFKNNMV
jgi:hypothetical protein